MQRYQGASLPNSPRIAVVANDAIGNWVMATPILQMLRNELNPGQLHMFCGSRTAELQSESDLCDETIELHGQSPEGFLETMAKYRGNYDLVLNLESTGLSRAATWILGEKGFVAGPCLGEGGRGDLAHQIDERGRLWADKNWKANDITIRYPFLKSGFISEIFARLCYLESPLAPYSVPRREVEGEVPDILISASASLPEKLWPLNHWAEATNRLAKLGYTIGLLGAKPADQSKYWIGDADENALLTFGSVVDLRGKFTLPEVTGALARARAVLTLDNGVLHLAVAAGAPTVGLYRHGIHNLWAPPFGKLTVLTPGEGNPVSVISVDRVVEGVQRALG